MVGSPYCIRGYEVDAHLGGPAALASARAALARRGLGLVLDFVPNHVAPDHPWTTDHPERFVQGTAQDLRDDPASFVEVAGRVLANGRDPYFPAWPDVVQLDAFSPELRARGGGHPPGDRRPVRRRPLRHGDADDERRVRPDVGRPGRRSPRRRLLAHGHPRGAGDAIPAFRFIAEAYWDLEWALQQQGFDYCYDKRLYDRLVHEDAEQVRSHLLGDLAYQDRLVRFVENHDEPRAASVFEPARQKAVTVAALTQTGARLVHEGQMEGRTVRLPVFLGRFPPEPVDADLAAFHRSLLAALDDPTFRTGTWRLCDARRLARRRQLPEPGGMVLGRRRPAGWSW